MNHKTFEKIDLILISEMHEWGIPALRIAIGIIFLWFGILKMIGMSPVVGFLAQTYPLLSSEVGVWALGLIETVIGAGLCFRRMLKLSLVLLWFQLLGTLGTFFLAPSAMFQGGYPLFLTFEGEFVLKNIVFFAASMVIAGYELKPAK